ncbi:CLaudin in Caenorhabditis [Trichostrongylus colubriformis]|uniref:CLaudin in Caenorhabditis n=1 Tax=Trichostrongylus colubriformis TaxID=6319 RepID=A0AAN8IVU5_TRICO
MCIFSACGQIVFGSVMGLCLIFTAVATFDGRMLSWDCLNHEFQCSPWQHAQRDYMITVAVFLCLAIVFQLIALIWNFVTFCACCCKKYIIHPLVGLSFVVTVFLFIAVIVYVASQGEANEFITYRNHVYDYSFWLAVCALILAAIDTIVAGMTVCLGERGL